MQDQQSNEVNFAPVCEVCKSQDESLRAVTYPFVFSVIFATFQRTFSGVFCAKHQRRYHIFASLITGAAGWLGIPFGFIMTPLTLFKLARGGIVHIQQVSNDWPDSVTAHTYMGLGYFHQEKIDDALLELDAGLELDPNSAAAHLIRGSVIVTQGKFLEAVHEFQIVSDSQPQWGFPHAFLAILHYNLNEKDLAQREIEKAIELQAEDGQTISMIGSYYVGLLDFKEAENYYLKAIQIANTPSDHLYLARIYTYQGKFENAQESIDNANQLEGDPASIYIARSNLALMQKDLESAATLMSGAIEEFPTRSDVWAELSFIHFQQGKIDDAIFDANRALELNPYNSSGYVELAFALHENGDVKESMEAARRAISLYPRHDRAHYILGLCYMDSGMNAEAIQEFETFLKLYWDRPLARVYKENAELLLEQLK